MQITKLPKEKRDKLLMIVVCGGAIVCGLYTFVVNSLRAQIEENETKILRVQEQLRQAERWSRMGGTVRANLDTKRLQLEARQLEHMAPTDKFKWFYNTLDNFRSSYDVNLLDISREPELGDAGLLPEFPYQAATFGVKLSACYHDFGKFIADFENRFPYMRVKDVRLELDPALRSLASTNSVGEAAADEIERLAITMKVVTLVKPPSTL